MTMRTITNIILLSAGILLSLTGCQKGTNDVEKHGNLVRFSATSANVNTRTAYSGLRPDGFERIDWTAGDKIMIWSDNATVRPDGTPAISGNDKLAIYNIGTISESGNKSVATIEDPMGNGLQYPDDDPGSTFWGVYPASALTASPTKLTDDSYSVPFSIDAEQALAENTNTGEDVTPHGLYDYVPDMQKALMVAYVTGAKAAAKSVEIPFKAAFTDFEFNISVGEGASALTISAMEIVSETVEGISTVAPTALSGKFTATCTSGNWTYAAASDAAMSVKATLPGDGLTLDQTHPLSLNVFALPQDLTNLKVVFYTNEGTKTLKLTNKEKTEFITFAGGKKHVMNGVILPTGWYFKYIDLDLKVLEWEAVDITGESSDFPQASQFAVGGESVKNGYTDIKLGDADHKDPYRQQWYFMPTHTEEGSDEAVTTVVTVFFKVMLPAEGRWELVPVGGTEENPVPADAALFSFQNAYSPTQTGSAALTGSIGTNGDTAVKINITYTGTDTNPHSFYFLSYAYDKAGNKYNIDSETQIYDRGRGYHTFFVNNPLYNTPINN